MVAVGLGAAVHGEVLGGGIELAVDRVVALQPAHEGDAHARGQVRVLAVGFLAAAPARVAEDVDVRRPEGQALVAAALALRRELVVLGARFVADGAGDRDPSAARPRSRPCRWPAGTPWRRPRARRRAGLRSTSRRPARPGARSPARRSASARPFLPASCRDTSAAARSVKLRLVSSHGVSLTARHCLGRERAVGGSAHGQQAGKRAPAMDDRAACGAAWSRVLICMVLTFLIVDSACMGPSTTPMNAPGHIGAEDRSVFVLLQPLPADAGVETEAVVASHRR